MRSRDFRLVTLGRLGLVDARGEGEPSLATRPRKLALLVVLALARRPVSRDALIGLFWPDQDDGRARHSLSDALSHLRRVVGRDALTMHQSQVAIADEAPLVVDALELEQAATRGDGAAALTLYGGHFLEHERIGASAAFEHWVDRERERLRRLFTTTTAAHCAALARGERWEECAEAARRWLDAEPLASDAQLTLLRALSAEGSTLQLARAGEAYERIRQRLRRDFDLAPDPAVVRLAHGVAARLAAHPEASAAAAPAQVTAAAVATAAASSPPPSPVPGADVGRDAADQEPPPLRRPHRLIAWSAAAGFLAVAVLGALARGAHGERREGAGVSDAAIAVLPFRVSGAASELGYLREGMMDLLDAKFTGEVGPRSVDPRAVLSSWRRAGGSATTDVSPPTSLRLAAGLGAKQVLLGSVVGTPTNLILSADVVSVLGGEVDARVSVAGPADSLTVLVDRLVAGVLVTGAGEARRLTEMMGTALPALRAYLNGRNLYRAGRFAEAITAYRQSLELDSTFALAALGIAAAGDWTAASESERVRRGLERAWRLRTRLGARDQLLFAAYIGPRFPGLRTGATELANWERALRATPDSPEAWYEVGDRYFHVGAAIDLPEHRRLAATAFARAVALDSAFVPPLTHLLELALQAGDAAEARRLAPLVLAHDSAATTADYLRWRLAVTLDDAASLRALRARMPAMSWASLHRIIGASQMDGVALADASRAAHAVRTHSAARHEKLLDYVAEHQLLLNGGRPRQALATLGLIRAMEPLPPGFLYSVLRADHLAVTDALYGGGDAAAGESAYRALAERSTAAPAIDPRERAAQHLDACVVELWRLEHGDAATALATMARLRSAMSPTDSASFYGGNPLLCVALLDALHASAAGRRDAPAALQHLDSLVRTWPPVFGAEFANLVVARLRESQGDGAGALAAVRRRPNYWTIGPRYLVTFLQQEGRLAERAGDRAAARAAYRHYLALRADPEPQLREDVARVRARLAQLR